eukprot:s905_g26.t5
MARPFHLRFFLTASLQMSLTDAAAHLGTLATLLNHEADNLKAMAVTLKAQEEDGGPDYRDAMEELAAVQAVGVGTSMLKMAGDTLSSRVGAEGALRGGRTGSLTSQSVELQAQQSEPSIEMTPYVQTRPPLGRMDRGLDPEEKRLQSLLEMRTQAGTGVRALAFPAWGGIRRACKSICWPVFLPRGVWRCVPWLQSMAAACRSCGCKTKASLLLLIIIRRELSCCAASEDETLAESYDRSDKCADAQTGSSCREARSQRHWPHTQPLKEAHLHEAVRPVPKGWSKAKASILQQEMQELELLSELYQQRLSMLEELQKGLRMGLGRHLPSSNTSDKPGPTALQHHRQAFLHEENSALEIATIASKGVGVRALAPVESGCCLLAESPVAVLQLQKSKTELLACQQCLCPLSTAMSAVVCQCGEQFCSKTCYEMAKQQGHERLCPALLGSQEASAMESLIHLLRDLPNVGEAFRLAVKLLARAITDLQLLELSAGLAGAPWWETAGISDHLIQEARDVTQVAFTLLQTVLTDLPAEFTADDLGFLVGQLRMNAVEVLVPVEDQLLASDLCGAAAVEGLALYFVASAVNHSCHPNCALQSCFASPGLRGWAVLQALRPIDEGEEVTIAYLAALLKTDRRHVSACSNSDSSPKSTTAAAKPEQEGTTKDKGEEPRSPAAAGEEKTTAPAETEGKEGMTKDKGENNDASRDRGQGVR